MTAIQSGRRTQTSRDSRGESGELSNDTRAVIDEWARVDDDHEGSAPGFDRAEGGGNSRGGSSRPLCPEAGSGNIEIEARFLIEGRERPRVARTFVPDPLAMRV